MTAFLLRTAGADDLDGIMAIETSTFATDAWSRRSMAVELEGRDSYYLVAEPEGAPGRIVGYAGLLAAPRSGDADVQTIAVAQEARGRGLGRALLTQLVAEARRRGAREVFLEVRADNPVAQGLYGSLGFERLAVRPRYYMPDGVDAIVMRLTVPTPTTTVAASAAAVPTPVEPTAPEEGRP